MITRRWFMIGSTAAISVASMTGEDALRAFAGGLQIQPVPAAHAYKIRRIYDIDVIPVESDVEPAEAIQVKIYHGAARDPLLSFHLSSQSYLRWSAPYRYELVFSNNDYARLEWVGSLGVGEINLFVEDDGVQYLEKHSFPFNGPAQIIPMMAA